MSIDRPRCIVNIGLECLSACPLRSATEIAMQSEEYQQRIEIIEQAPPLVGALIRDEAILALRRAGSICQIEENKHLNADIRKRSN